MMELMTKGMKREMKGAAKMMKPKTMMPKEGTPSAKMPRVKKSRSGRARVRVATSDGFMMT